MAALFFFIVCAICILRPIKNAPALDSLGTTDFYKVYLVSAAVVLFVPLFNRLATLVPWRILIPSVALFFAANLALFRAFYVEGGTAFGLIFYGWYDLFAAALVTQFFLATQLVFDARMAKRAYPVVIAGGSIGATLGGAVTGFFAERVGYAQPPARRRGTERPVQCRSTDRLANTPSRAARGADKTELREVGAR